VENLIRNVDKEAKIGVVVIMSALFGTDILSSQHRYTLLIWYITSIYFGSKNQSCRRLVVT
jgi:hypothetical protein